MLQGRDKINKNEELIRRYAMPMVEAYSQVISQGINLIESGLNNYHVWRALERAYTGKGFLYQAWIAREKALMRER